MHPITAQSTLQKKQTRIYGPKRDTPHGTMTVTVRYDDSCNNGHNSFAITANCSDGSGGCMHEAIIKEFPELAPYIKWHLCSSDGPMHYIANTLYHASDRDYCGLLKGERKQLCNGKSGLPAWQIVATKSEWVDSAEMPTTPLTIAWEPVWIVGEGKERQLDYARSTAVWPEATEAELTSPNLKQRLEERLPQLLADFRTAVESLGFTW